MMEQSVRWAVYLHGESAAPGAPAGETEEMGRTDFAPLRVPGLQEAAAEPSAAATQFDLAELFNRPPRAGAAGGADQAQGPPKAASPGGTETAPAGRREPARCPHCSAGLSAAEAKLGRCLGCGKAIGGGGALVVHI